MVKWKIKRPKKAKPSKTKEAEIIHLPTATPPEERQMSKVTLAELRDMAKAAQGGIDHIYLHWSAGHYGQFFADYHLNIDQDGSVHASTADLAEHKNHTYMRNQGAIGVALAGCFGATTEDLGAEAPTDQQVEALAQVVAVLCSELGLAIDLKHVLTHAEAANNLDGENPGYESNGYPDGLYGPGYSCERWDLWFLHNGDSQWSGGDVVRGKALWYQHNGLD